MCEPRRVHWVAAKHILRYLQGIVDYGLDYRQGDEVRLAGYTAFDWACCASDRKSTSGCCFGLGLAVDRKSTRLNSSHLTASRMPSSA